MPNFSLRYYCIIVLALCVSKTVAQDMPRTVIGNAGDYYENLLFGNLHWTVGEVAVSHLENGMQLSEGFHQGYYELLVSAPERTAQDWQAQVFPNPTVGLVYIQAGDSFLGHAILYNNLGQQLWQKRLLTGQAEIDFSRLAAGTYWLRLRSDLGQERNFQIQKIRP